MVPSATTLRASGAIEADAMEVFSGFDDDNNKRLDMDEFSTLVRGQFAKLNAPPPPQDEIETVFRKIDKDESGTIEQGEFVQFWKKVKHLGFTAAFQVSALFGGFLI